MGVNYGWNFWFSIMSHDVTVVAGMASREWLDTADLSVTGYGVCFNKNGRPTISEFYFSSMWWYSQQWGKQRIIEKYRERTVKILQ